IEAASRSIGAGLRCAGTGRAGWMNFSRLPTSMTSPSPTPPAPAPAPGGRPTRQLLLVMLIALASAFALSQAFRTLGAIMATPLSQHFSLSPLQIGLWASAFHLAFGLLQ